MDTKFTPGTWTHGVGTIRDLHDHVEHVAVYVNPHKIVALTGIADAPDREESEANARLIASAPDLYAALEAVLAWMEDNPPAKAKKHDQAAIWQEAIFYRERQTARIALRKATEES